MDWTSISFDWNQVRAFLITAEEGSFSAGARAFGVTQPTLGRQVSALEDRLGVTLFERVGRQLALTDAGYELLDHVRIMGEAANNLSRAASGQSQKLEGRVCISATDLVIQLMLPDILRQIRNRYPGIDIDLLASDKLSDLQRREADIAIRHTRPEQPDLIARLLYESPAVFCASASFLEGKQPASLDDLAHLNFVGFDQSGRMIDYLTNKDVPLKANQFHIRSENGVVAWEMVKQGFGIGLMARDIVARTPGVLPVLPDFCPATIPFWLVSHREVHTSRRIRLVYDMLADGLTAASNKRNNP